MLKTIFSFAFILIVFVAFAQETIDTTIINKIKEEEIQHSQLKNIAHNLLDVCGSRLTNSDGYRRALKYTTETFMQWGLTHAGPEAWGEFGKGWNNVHNYIALKQPYSQVIIGYAHPWTKRPTDLFLLQLLWLMVLSLQLQIKRVMH